MKIHMLVEGQSERSLFETWIRRKIKGVPVTVHPHQGKGSLPTDLAVHPDRLRRGLLDQLPAKLRGFEASLDGDEDSVLILVDADNDDPVTLANSIGAAVADLAPSIPVAVCVAVEETEAFYLGDLRGIQRAFPNADMTLARKYIPDSICGTWEYFERVIGGGGGRKVEWAEAMGRSLTTRASASRSPSFKSLCRNLEDLSRPGDQVKKKARKNKRPKHK